MSAKRVLLPVAGKFFSTLQTKEKRQIDPIAAFLCQHSSDTVETRKYWCYSAAFSCRFLYCMD